MIDPETAIEKQMEELRWKILNAPGVVERLRLTAELLGLCQDQLKSPIRQNRYSVFHGLGYLLKDRVCDAEIWDWLQEVAMSADKERRVDMRVAILELVPDPPVV